MIQSSQGLVCIDISLLILLHFEINRLLAIFKVHELEERQKNMQNSSWMGVTEMHAFGEYQPRRQLTRQQQR